MAITVITIIGMLAGLGTTAAYVPQVVKAIRTKQTKDLSLMMYLILNVGLALWLTYGILKTDWPIIIANSITLMLSVPILVVKIKNG